MSSRIRKDRVPGSGRGDRPSWSYRVPCVTRSIRGGAAVVGRDFGFVFLVGLLGVVVVVAGLRR